MKHLALLAAATTTLSPVHALAQVQNVPTAQSVMTEAGPVAVEEIAKGLDHPWGMTFLPDGRILVTERNSGELRIVTEDGTVSSPVEGTPQVFAQGQGGLLDVALHPDFEENRLVYLSYAEPSENGASTALGRGRLVDATGDAAGEDKAPLRIADFEPIFVQQPKVSGPNHFGGRIVFTPDDHVFLTLGERFKFDPAQDLSNHLGSLVRLNLDGTVPDDNPFVGRADAEDEIWSYGHRNVQAAAINPESDALWIAEMGPLGGDELNLPEPGENYGWPEVSWGINYDGTEIPDPPTRPEFADAAKHWSPVISPSGMAFYTGEVFPAWKNSVLIGGLSSGEIVRLTYEGATVTGEEERIPLGARVRDVVEGPDGLVYVLTDQDDGKVWRLRPLE